MATSLSDLAAGLVGGLGVAPGANIGPEGAVFEATHGSAPKYKGLNKVNPDRLDPLGHADAASTWAKTDAAERLEKAVADVIAEGQIRHLRPESRPRRSVGRRHARNGRRHHSGAEVKRVAGACVRQRSGFVPTCRPLSRNSQRSAAEGRSLRAERRLLRLAEIPYALAVGLRNRDYDNPAIGSAFLRPSSASAI